MRSIKIWLQDILACPIDKHFPLKLFIFSFETKSDEFLTLFKTFEKRNINIIKNEKIINISKKNGIVYLKDNVIIEKSPIEKYLKLIISSINELTNITDKSPNDITKKCFNIITSEIKNKILEFIKDLNIEKLDELLPELYFLNKIKTEIEIESGLLFCEKCLRWFPIIETIPQMLPDEYRDEKKETQFLQINKNLLDVEFLKQDLKPFNI